MTRNSLLTLGIATTGLTLIDAYYRGWFHGIGKPKEPTIEETNEYAQFQKPGGTSYFFEPVSQSKLLI